MEVCEFFIGLAQTKANAVMVLFALAIAAGGVAFAIAQHPIPAVVTGCSFLVLPVIFHFGC